MKPHIHYHSDCLFFAGCENMLANFFNDVELGNSFRLTFSYRHTPEYEEGFRSRVKTNIQTYPLHMLDFTEALNRLPQNSLKIPCKFVFHLLLKYLCILWNTLILFFLFGRDKIDILHINNGGYPGAYSCLAAVLAARIRGIPTIIYVVNNIATPYSRISRWMDYLPDRLVVGGVTRFICGSVQASLALRQVLDLNVDQVINLPNGIASRLVTETKAQVFDRLGLSQDRFYLGIVAILEERKGHKYLLEAMQMLKSKELGTKMPMLLIEGTGPLEQHLKEFVQQAGLIDDVKFIGTEEQVFNLMNAVDVIVLPSVANEDFPNVILEAMSLGKPVIASRMCGIPEQIEHEQSGLLVEPRDVDGLSNAITCIVQNETLRTKISRNALDRFYKLFSSHVSVKRYNQLYNQMIERKTA